MALPAEPSQEEILRYSRHLLIPEVGVEGQRRLAAARVLLVGVGGLGSPAALYLAAAGVGRLGLVDCDTVEISNLQRQILYRTPDVAAPKLDAARAALRALNPTIEIAIHPTRLGADDALDVIGGYDIVIDGTDNFPTRYLLNDACVLLGKPDVYGAIFRFDGQAAVFDSRRGPCYRCLFPEPPPPELVTSCADGGVLGVLPGIIGAIQAAETIKLVIGRGAPLVGRLLVVDALAMRFREIRVRRSRDCPVCGDHPRITALADDYDRFCGMPGAAAEAARAVAFAIDATEVKTRLDQRRATLLDVREPHEWQITRIAGAIHIPLSELAERLDELPPTGDIVLCCRTGLRSLRALELLRAHVEPTRLGILRGGIDAWSTVVDPRVRRY